MSTTKTLPPEDIIVKEEQEVSSEENEDLDEAVDTDMICQKGIKMEIKEEREVSGGRRRSRRLQQGDPEKKKSTTCPRMGPEEAYRQKLKRKYERKKQRIANMSEEDRAILREKSRISHLRRRQKLRENGHVPKRRPKCAKNTVSNRPELSEEEKERRKRDSAMKHKFNYLVRETLLTEEEREQQRLKRYLQTQAWKASKSKEEMEAMKTKRNERVKKRLQEDEEYRQHISQRNRNWRQNLTEEKRERYMGSVKKAVSKYLKNLKVKNPEMYNKNYEKFKAKLREKTATETPEQRQKRLQRYKINAARTKLKKELEKEGMAPELIQSKLDELVEEMKSRPLPPPSEYKPRPRKSGGIKKTEQDPEDGQEVNEDDEVEFACDDEDEAGHANMPYTYHFGLNTLEDEEAIRGVELESNIIIPGVDPSILEDRPVSSITPTLEEFSNDEGGDFSPPATPPDLIESEKFVPSQPLLLPSSLPTVKSPNKSVDEKMPSPSLLPLLSPSPFQPKSSFKSSSKPPLQEKKPSASQPPSLPSQPPSPPALPLSSFKCPQCPQVLDSDPALRNHLNTFHLHTCWKCPTCYQVLLSPAELSEHFKSHENFPEQKSPTSEVDKSPKFICMRCPYISERQRNNRFETLTSLSGHVRRKHPESYWPCPNCKILKYSKDRLQFHRICCTKKL